jgi:uncharacterized membrane protein HdeD (DUF308 family)
MSLSTSLLWRGMLAIGIGVVSVAWPGITIGAFVILFAVYAFVMAGSDALRAFASDRAGPVAGWLLLALGSFAAGVAALAWPGITAVALAIWIGIWALVTGCGEVAMAFGTGETAGQRAMWSLSGLVSIALAFVLFLQPDIGASALAVVFGLFSIVHGTNALVLSARAHEVRTAGRRLVDSSA